MLGLFALAMACEIIVPTIGNWWYGPNGEEPEIALHLYRGHGFLSPYDPSPDAQPSSWSPPVYPAILSVFYHLFGAEGKRLRVALVLFHSGLFAAATVGLFCLGELLWSRAVGVIAALIHICLPVFLHNGTDFWDVYVAAAMFVWLMVAVASLRRRGNSRYWHAAGLGLAFGLLSLTNAAYLLTYPLLVWLAAGGRSWRGRLAFGGVALACFMLVLAPWTLRNYHQFGRLYYVRGEGKWEIWFANTIDPPATGWMGSQMRKTHVAHNKGERAELMEMGEPAFCDLYLEKFQANYRDDPQAFWNRTLLRVVLSFCGEPRFPVAHHHHASEPTFATSGITNDPLDASLTFLALIGALVAMILRRRGAWVLGCGILAIVPYQFLMVNNRYLLGLRITMPAMAGFLIWEMVGSVVEARRRRRLPTRGASPAAK